MATFLVRRLVGMTFVMFVVSFLTWFIFFILPGGDPAVRALRRREDVGDPDRAGRGRP